MKIKNIIKTIKQNKVFLVSAHINLDMDALSSELAIYYYLKSLGKTVYIVNNEPTPKRLKIFSGLNRIRPYREGMRLKYDVAIIVDCGELGRIGKVRKLLLPDKKIINFDHHVGNHHFTSLNSIDPKASSTAEIIYRFFKEARFKINKNVATILYSGVMSDTGNFCYGNTTPEALAIAAELRRFKFSAYNLYRQLYEVIPLKEVNDFLAVIKSFQSLCGGKLIALELSQKDLAKFAGDFDLRDTIFKFFRLVKDVEVIAILSEINREKTKVNLRSMSGVDVAKIAGQFKGGGHKAASGCVISKDIKTASRNLLKEIKKCL